jgi:hypothetical protein
MKIDRRRSTNIFQGRVCDVCNNLLDYVVYINNKRRARCAALARNCCMNDNPRRTLKGTLSHDEYFFKVLKIETIAGQWALANKSMSGASGLSDATLQLTDPFRFREKHFYRCLLSSSSSFYFRPIETIRPYK